MGRLGCREGGERGGSGRAPVGTYLQGSDAGAEDEDPER